MPMTKERQHAGTMGDVSMQPCLLTPCTVVPPTSTSLQALICLHGMQPRTPDAWHKYIPTTQQAPCCLTAP